MSPVHALGGLTHWSLPKQGLLAERSLSCGVVSTTWFVAGEFAAGQTILPHHQPVSTFNHYEFSRTPDLLRDTSQAI